MVSPGIESHNITEELDTGTTHREGAVAA